MFQHKKISNALYVLGLNLKPIQLACHTRVQFH